MKRRILITICMCALGIALAGCAAKAAWLPLWSTPMPGRTPSVVITPSVTPTHAADETKLFATDADKMDAPKVIVYKSKHTLEVWDGDTLMARMQIAIGKGEDGPKTKQGDNKTPEGDYYICKTSDQGKFHKSLFLSYPNTDDANAGLSAKTIKQSEVDAISTAIDGKKQPPWNTALGGEIGINGIGTGGEGKTGDWTSGSIAVSDEDVDYLWKFIKVGVEVQINP